MKEGSPSTTAINSAMVRASHLLLDAEPKIFRDDFALALSGVGDEAALRAALDKRDEPLAREFGRDFAEFFAGTLRSSMTTRSRFTEEELEKAIRMGISQYVLLGAGLDSFALRRRDLAEVLKVFEIDHSSSQQWKRARISELGIALPSNLTFVPVDFERETVFERLGSAAYQPKARAFFSWLGVTQYLTKEAVRNTLRQIATTVAVGSEIVFEYTVPQELVDERHRKYLAIVIPRVAEMGEPWLSFFSPGELAEQLREMGFDEISHFGPAEAYTRYFAGRTDRLPCQTVHRLIRARVG